MRAVAYIRFAALGADAAAPDPHRTAVERWAERTRVEVASWHVDIGVSGATPIAERPALVAAYRAIREHEAGILVAANADQFSHDELVSWLIERAALTERATLRTADEELAAPSSGTTPSEAPVGFTRGSVDLARAYDRVTSRARIRASLAAKQARGERVGNVPFGYRLAADGVHTEPEAGEQAVIRLIRELAESLSQRAIVIQLAERGIVGRTGAPLKQTQIARILQRS